MKKKVIQFPKGDEYLKGFPTTAELVAELRAEGYKMLTDEDVEKLITEGKILSHEAAVKAIEDDQKRHYARWLEQNLDRGGLLPSETPQNE